MDLLIKECRNCGSTFNPENDKIQIGPLDRFTIIWVKTGKCHFCPPETHRTLNKKDESPDYSGWNQK